MSESSVPPAVSIRAAVFCALMVSCSRHGVDSLDARPPPDFAAENNPDALQDPLWREAVSLDALELARLSDREGAQGLLDGVEKGGAAASIGLMALPYADDSMDSLRRLGEILAQVPASTSAPLLDSIAGILSRPRRQSEVVDAEGADFCAQKVVALAVDKGAAAPIRAQAISVARLFADLGALRRDAIPTDLD